MKGVELMQQLERLKENRDMMCVTLMGEIDKLNEFLNEARQEAEKIRDLYAAEIDESVKAFPFPWESDE